MARTLLLIAAAVTFELVRSAYRGSRRSSSDQSNSAQPPEATHPTPHDPAEAPAETSPSIHSPPMPISHEVSKADTRCAVCETPCADACSGCQKVFYCDREHQKQDWKRHKRECSPDGSFRAIFLPVNSTEPQIVTLGYNTSSTIGSLLGRPGDPFMGPKFDLILVTTDGTNGPPLEEKGYTLTIYCRAGARNDGSPVNECVHHLAGKSSLRSYRGPMVVVREKRDPNIWFGGPRGKEHMKLSDLGPIVKYFQQNPEGF